MRRNLSTWRRALLASFCLVGLLSPVVAQQSPPPGDVPNESAHREPAEEHATAERLVVPKFWIGIQAQPLDEALKSHLNLDHGVVAGEIPPGSPADKAGVKRHDILQEVNGRPIHEVTDLLTALAEGNDQPVELKILRRGQPETIEIKPEKRPAEAMPQENGEPSVRDTFLNFAFPDQERERIMFFNRPEAGPFSFEERVEELPDNVSITIKMHGKEPVHIEVRRGDESWTVNENELDRLPNDLRSRVESLLHPRRGMFGWRQGRFGELVPDQVPVFVTPGNDGEAWSDVRRDGRRRSDDRDLREELDSLKEQLRSLQEAVTELAPKQG